MLESAPRRLCGDQMVRAFEVFGNGSAMAACLIFSPRQDVSLPCRGGSVIGQFFPGDWGRGVAGIGMRRRVDGGRFMSVARGNSMRTTSVGVVRIATKGPGDVSGLLSFIESGKIDPRSILAILGKTEGNGGVNDFTREYAVSTLCAVLAPYVDLPPHRLEERIAFVMSGGTEGVLSPHITVFTRADVVGRQSDGISGKRLSIGIAQTRDFLPEELGRGVQIQETAKAVAMAMADAAIVDPQDVHFVQIKCPLLTSDRVEAAAARGNRTVTNSAYGSMAYSRGASALGVAVALGEINGKVGDECILRNFELFSSVASTSAGIELMHNVVIVLGNSNSSASPFVIGHGAMRDSVDSAAALWAWVSPKSPIRSGATVWSISLPKPRRPPMAMFAETVTPCSTIPTSAPPD